ncbi:MAG: hypothetical protein KF869_15045 [Phycisphaeraceae bacterium]|nr:hypothetical protein [Phycisphaeraceae bacterium]
MRVPQDIANLFAITVRDVLWFKPGVLALLKECGVPAGVIVEAKRMYEGKKATIPVVKHVLDRCAESGAEGIAASRQLLTKLYYWNDLHSVAADRKDAAVASLKAFREGFDRYKSQEEYQRAQKAQEQKMHSERVDRRTMSALDHATLRGFRDEFDRVSTITDERARGTTLEPLINKIFDYYGEDSKGPVRRVGEQIDGTLKFDSHWHYVEIRWKADKTTAQDVSVLRDRARDSYGGDTKALFISINGYSTECLESLANKSDERVILMDGYDLRCVLNCDIALDVLLAEKQAALVRDKRPFVSAAEIIRARTGGTS